MVSYIEVFLRWFKHYSDAEHSDGLATLILKGGFEAYGRYWRLLEFLSARFDGECVNFTFHSSIIRQLLRLRSATNLGTFTDLTATIRGLNVELIGNEVKIYAPILLDLQDRDFKKSRKNREQNAPKNKIKNKIKINNKKIQKKENSAPSSGLDDLDNFDRDKILTLPDGHEILAEIWNDVASELNLSKVTTPLSEKRVKLCKAAIKSMPSLERWKMAFSGIASSDFHLGKNDREWKASFDWLIQSTKENYLRMAEKGEEINAAQN